MLTHFLWIFCLLILYNFLPNQVEFPEARIFEETLNVLLYEHRGKGPDAELMQATRGSRDGAQGYNSDEDVEDKLDRAMRRK